MQIECTECNHHLDKKMNIASDGKTSLTHCSFCLPSLGTLEKQENFIEQLSMFHDSVLLFISRQGILYLL